MATKVLEGVKVADFGQTVVGSVAGGMLASYGAEVIKIESRTRVDYNRQSPPFAEGTAWRGDRSGLWANVGNAGKHGITLNLNHSRGVEVAKRIVAWADIVIENFRGQRMAKWGLGYEDLRKINPDIIMLSASAYGQTGSYATHGGTGGTLVAMSGISQLTGWPDGPPMQPTWVYSDFFAPKFALLAIVAALDYRRRTGKGQYIDLSQLEVAVHFINQAILEYGVNKRELGRIGNRLTYAAPCGVYRCKGNFRWCAITVISDEEWKNFCRIMGKPALAENPQFATRMGRLKNVEKLDRLVEGWTINYSPGEVMELLQSAGVAAGVVQNGEDLARDPQLESRNYYWELDHPAFGKFVYSGMPAKLSKTSYEMSRSPSFGEHNEYVYTKLLGMSDEEFVQFLNEGVFE
jgi:benzylsuccinate CoA-transferase BbsF subunit